MLDPAVERIGAHHIPNQRRQTFRAFAEVDRSRRNEHAHRARWTDHFKVFNAPMIRRHRGFGAGPDRDARSPYVHFNDRGTPIRRLVLGALPRR
jgi:hypothetical protein